MSYKSNIDWCDATWNPVIGCSKISPGCTNCYAEKMACRLACMEYAKMKPFGEIGNYMHVINSGKKKWNGKTFFAESQLQKPLKWKKPRKIFVCSMGDLFHESVEFNWQYKVFEIIVNCPQHTFQILTKRPGIMKTDMEDIIFHLKRNYPSIELPLKNVWLGVTAENQEQANKRIPILLQIPAKVKFVSIEPMLSWIYLELAWRRGLDWVICGGETGPGARPIKREWVEDLQKQCENTNVPFFFKSWGTSKEFKGLKIKKEFHLIDGIEYKEFP